MSGRAETRTGGRVATTRHIFGKFALSVGMPNAVPPSGWRWVPLTDVARLESGHTPSRRHNEYWDGDIPWVGIRDAKMHHGETINDTIQSTNALGIQNSSARILPAGTVCLSRTASVGYVVTMGRPMATSQDFANWICSEQIDRRFLVYLFLAEQESLLRFASGAIHQTIYYPELKAFHVCLPPPPEQERIVAILDEARERTRRLQQIFSEQLDNVDMLNRSFLQKAFAGGFTGVGSRESRQPVRQDISNTAAASFGASILAIAYEKHRVARREKSFGHVKAQKLLHLTESIVGIDLGRDPVKDAAGPNDFDHMRRVEDWAERREFFRFYKSDGRYHFEKLPKYAKQIAAARETIEPYARELTRLIDFLVPMDTQEVEVLATVHAAWNNLLLDAKQAEDDAIVRAAREDWHSDKLKIPPRQFVEAIRLIKKQNLVPSGKAKRVRNKYLI